MQDLRDPPNNIRDLGSKEVLYIYLSYIRTPQRSSSEEGEPQSRSSSEEGEPQSRSSSEEGEPQSRSSSEEGEPQSRSSSAA